MTAAQKVFDEGELAGIVVSHRRAGRQVVFTNGAFDLLHVGHVRMLEEAATRGGVLVVAVNDDASVRRAKGAGRPIVPDTERAEMVAALSCVDYVVVFSDDTVDRLLEVLQPDVHAKGRDYTPHTIPERGTDERLGVAIALVGDTKEHSSTEMLARAAHGSVPDDRVRPLERGDVRGFALSGPMQLLADEGWMDLARWIRTEEGAVVERHRTRFVRRLEIGGQPVFAKGTFPLERGRSPIVEFQNHLALRAGGFRAPEPWLCMEGRVDGRPAGVLVTKEAPGLRLDAALGLLLPRSSGRERAAMANGLGRTVRALHTARFLPRDLQAWHVLVEGSPAGGRRSLTFIDLQRLERGGRRLSRRQASLGLAALALSLRGVTSDRFRLAVLRAYLGGSLRAARPWIATIEKRMAKLATRSTFRDLAEHTA